MEKIYVVTTEGDCEGRGTSTLGYCTGNLDDIRAYYDDRKTYALRVEEIEVVHITSDSTMKRKALIKKKQELEEELDRIKNSIK